MPSIRSLSIFISITGIFATASMALATDADQSQPAASAAQKDDANQLGEIVVTAQKRSERLVDVPISVTAVTAEQLANAGVDSFENINEVAVGTVVNRTGIYFQPTIRGITTGVVGAGQENNIAVYVDGFYQPSQVGIDMAFNNVQSVQVLKGPQGTLFGRNATGGAILIDTPDPSHTPVAKAAVSFGRFNEAIGQVYLSDGITDKLAFDIAAYSKNSDGYIKDVAGWDSNATEDKDFRSKWVFSPAESMKFTGIFEYAKVSDATGLDDTYYAHQVAALVDPAATIATAPDRTSLNYAPASWTETTSVGVKSEFNFGGPTLTSFTRYSHEYGHINFDLDGSELRIFEEHLNTRLNNAQEELDLHDTNGPVDWVTGVFVSDTSAQYFNESYLVDALDNAYSPNVDSRLWTRAAAAFGDVTYRVNDDFSVIGGLRYSWERRTFFYAQPESDVMVDHVSKDWDAVTPRAVVKYDLDRNSNVYVSFSKGFKSGTFNTTVPNKTPVNPENVKAYEVGYKLQRGSFQFQTAAYYYDYRDMQVSQLQIIAGEEVSNLSNAARSRIYGVEAQISAPLWEELSYSAGVNYNHARYVDYKDASVFPVAPGGLVNSSTPISQDWSGLRIIGAPDWTTNFALNWSHPTSVGIVGVGGSVDYTSTYAPTADDQLNGSYRYEQGGYASLNMNTSLALNSQWKLSVWGRNLTDEYHKISYGGNPFGDYVVYAEPRMYGGRVEYSFK